ncbi:MAG TPA: DUF1743 domain-containing protein [Thermoplasmata archaeon]|nr:DUF1743 domain-containing protein [Thermoplasmata archaeon]
MRGSPVWSYARGRPVPGDRIGPWLEASWQRLLRASRSGERGTDPALVAVDRRLPSELYWRAVREVVPVAEARAALRAAGAIVRTEGSDRGLVGASAAVAWPGRRSTWELIAYRASERWGRPRDVSAASVRKVAGREPSLFLCDDPRTRRLLVAPHTPCPILYGLRGTSPEGPLRARRGVRSEPVERWLLFRTNQGTGDHLARRPIRDIRPFMGAIVSGTVRAVPSVLEGGHVAFELEGAEGDALPCVAFEPTKLLPRVARSLAPGDHLQVWGSRAKGPALHLEGIRLVRIAPRWGPVRPPRCPGCDRPSHSLGRQRGYRCPSCRRRWPPEAARRVARPPAYPPGEYHPTASARRHLAPRAPEL